MLRVDLRDFERQIFFQELMTTAERCADSTDSIERGEFFLRLSEHAPRLQRHGQGIAGRALKPAASLSEYSSFIVEIARAFDWSTDDLNVDKAKEFFCSVVYSIDLFSRTLGEFTYLGALFQEKVAEKVRHIFGHAYRQQMFTQSLLVLGGPMTEEVPQDEYWARDQKMSQTAQIYFITVSDNIAWA